MFVARSAARYHNVLTVYLGPNWLADTHVEQLDLALSAQLAQSANLHIVHPTWFTNLLRIYCTCPSEYIFLDGQGMKYSHATGEHLATHDQSQLGGLINVQIQTDGSTILPARAGEGNHWVAFVISKHTSTIAYGDSQLVAPPEELIQVLIWWTFDALRHNLAPEHYNLTAANFCDHVRAGYFVEVVEHLRRVGVEKKIVEVPENIAKTLELSQKAAIEVTDELKPDTKGSKRSPILKQPFAIVYLPPHTPTARKTSTVLSTPTSIATPLIDDPDVDEETVDPALLVDVVQAKKDPRKGGRPPAAIMDRLTVKCYHRDNPAKLMYQCAAKCGWRVVLRTTDRVLKHCKDCRKLDTELRNYARTEAGGRSLSSAISKDASKEHRPQLDEAPSKRAQTDGTDGGVDSGSSVLAPSKSEQKKTQTPLAEMALTHGRRERHTKLDLAIVILFCVAGLPPFLISRQEFLDVLYLADKTYAPPTGDRLESKLIPNEQEFVRAEQIKHLQTEENLTMSYDGGTTTGKEAFFTFHVSTESDEVSLMEGIEATAVSHTAKWIASQALECVSTTRNTLTFFHHSHPAIASLRVARKALGIKQGLEAIGKTRFATLFITAVSVQRNILAITEVGKLMEDEFEKLREYYQPANSPSVDTFKFHTSLAQLIKMGLPTTKAIACLEGEHITAADVFLFYHAVMHETYSAVTNTRNRFPSEVQNQIIRILNKHYRQLFLSGPISSSIYLTATYLNPNLLRSDLFKCDTNSQTSLPGVKYITVFKAVADFLRDIATNEALFGHKPALTKWGTKATLFLAALKAELLTYTRGDAPYDIPLHETGPRSCMQWWDGLVGRNSAQILPHLALKVYAVRVNSMAEERTVSKFTWITPPLCSRLAVPSTVAMTQIGQYYRSKPQQKRPSANRIPIVHTRFCDIKASVFPTDRDCDVAPSLIHDVEADDLWLDEIDGVDDVADEETIDLLAGAHINLDSHILASLLSDEPIEVEAAAEEIHDDGDVGEEAIDNDFGNENWLD
ncbi:hypothetical protein HGRIS_006785 [Hohenbuehelia grisea]|uniref:Ubiquitin-like protease family profile domain-containing protein n=1 Tax=Hohenbuehelia grisea TaxID=104357 RepID=A0ABR3JA53_9AGAR